MNWLQRSVVLGNERISAIFQWPLGSWVRYKAMADDTAHPSQRDFKYRFTAYEIGRDRDDGNQLETNIVRAPHPEDSLVEVCFGDKAGIGCYYLKIFTFITGPIRRLDANMFLANDCFLGSVLCSMDERLYLKLNDNVDDETEVQV